jgi:hypothetical protein
MTNRAEIVITALDKASAVINRIADRMDVLGQKSNIGKAFDRLGNSKGLERVNQAFGKIANNVKTVATYGAAAAAAIGFGFLKSVNAVDDFADSLANAGVKGKELVELSAVRDYLVQFGVASEDSSAAVLKLVGNISAARAGAKEQQAAFAAAGISMDDLRKKTPVDVLQKMMTVFNQSDKAGAKLKVLEALAGRSSVKMVEGLSQGTKAFEQYKEKSKNALLTEKDFTDAGNAADSITRISQLIARAGQKMAAVAAPKLQAFLDRREAGLLELIPKLVDWVDRFIASLDEKKVLEFFEDVAGMFSGIATFFSKLHDLLGTTVTVIAALAVIFAPAIASIASLLAMLLTMLPALSAAFAAVSVFLAANPIVAAIVLIALLAKVVYDNWDGIVGGLKALWESFAEVVSAVWDLVTGTVMAAIAKITGWFTGLYDSFVLVWERIAGWFGDKMGTITSMLPDWLTGGSVNVNVNGPSSSLQTSAQTIAKPSGKTEVGGRIKIELIGAPAKVTQLSSTNAAVPIEVNSGLYGVGA